MQLILSRALRARVPTFLSGFLGQFADAGAESVFGGAVFSRYVIAFGVRYRMLQRENQLLGVVVKTWFLQDLRKVLGYVYGQRLIFGTAEMSGVAKQVVPLHEKRAREIAIGVAEQFNGHGFQYST